MDKAGTRRMHILGMPLYAFTLYICLVTSSRGAIWFFGLAAVVGLIYTLFYNKLHDYFAVQYSSSNWQFLVSILCLQVVIGLLLVAVA
jgi:hypothetical protein